MDTHCLSSSPFTFTFPCAFVFTMGLVKDSLLRHDEWFGHDLDSFPAHHPTPQCVLSAYSLSDTLHAFMYYLQAFYIYSFTPHNNPVEGALLSPMH